MWMLYRRFERDCECSCDETAMQGKSETEVKKYLRLLIEEAREHKKRRRVSLRWKAGFSNNAKKIKERMDNLMKNKKWNRFAACVLVAALTFANSMTVFAYRDTHHVEVTGDVSPEEIENYLDLDVAEFVPDEIDGNGAEELELLEVDKICYDRQFTDESGNIYPVSEDDSVEPYCDHTYEPGTYSTHRKLSGGGCEVNNYKAQRCSKCGYVLQGEQIGWHKYDVCPH